MTSSIFIHDVFKPQWAGA